MLIPPLVLRPSNGLEFCCRIRLCINRWRYQAYRAASADSSNSLLERGPRPYPLQPLANGRAVDAGRLPPEGLSYPCHVTEKGLAGMHDRILLGPAHHQEVEELGVKNG